MSFRRRGTTAVAQGGKEFAEAAKKTAAFGTALKPDLVLGSQLRAADKYDALSKIAPTVFSIRPGVPRPQNQQVEDLAVEISPERTDEAAADWIFTAVYGAKDKTKRDSAEANPLWKGLEAVKQGRAKDVPDGTWYLGLGVTAADNVLDDLRGFLVR